MNNRKSWIAKAVVCLSTFGAFVAEIKSWGTECTNDLSWNVEGDVFPAISGILLGDGFIGLNDWHSVADYVTGSTVPFDGCLFALADCAPRATLGDGAITVIDCVQAFRYSLGSDPLEAGGGPDSPIPSPRQPGIGLRSVSASGNIVRGSSSVVTVHAQAAGDEFAVAFTLEFDASQLHLQTVEGADQTFFRVNQREAANGKVGIVVLHADLQAPPGTPFPSGTQALAKFTFVATGWTNVSTVIHFTGALAVREVSTTNAVPLETTFQNVSLPFVGGGPHLTAAQMTATEFNLILSGDPGDYLIESSSDLIHWSPLSTIANAAGVTAFTDSPAPGAGQRFYRAVPKP